jgi:hypothetical protein
MKALRITLFLLVSLILSVPVFAKGSHGGRSSSSHSHSSHASKKSHNAGSHDGHYEGGHGLYHKGGFYVVSQCLTRRSSGSRRHMSDSGTTDHRAPSRLAAISSLDIQSRPLQRCGRARRSP